MFVASCARAKHMSLLPCCGVQQCAAAPRPISFIALLLDDGTVALLSPPDPVTGESPAVVGTIRFPPDAPPFNIACSPDGALLAVASKKTLSLYVIGAESSDAPASPRDGRQSRPSQVSMQAHMRWRSRLTGKTMGLDVATLVADPMGASTHGVAAVASWSGLTVLCTSDDSGKEARNTAHLGCPMGACGPRSPSRGKRSPPTATSAWW